ncbi:HU family DNA-binding protein [Ornithinimicrobium cavernae]|uniref:HU family DNA-binding protein n=1 Tax=Ornithinimicrobium cavernae TaxID=2666047 RepID=UPI000D69809E|nr:HU family DNA-binding protein [Ornithinimicrobium cavernae]
MNKAELIERLSTQLGSRRDATLAVESLVDVVIREVAAGGSVGITGFGTFERADRAPRTGRNPRTGESVPIAGTSTPRFRPGTYFKKVVTEPEQLPSEGLAGGRAPVGGSPPARASTGNPGTAGRSARSASTRRSAAQLVPAEDVATVETELKDSARKTLRKSQRADSDSRAKSKKTASGKGKNRKETTSDKGRKKDKKSGKK